MASWVQATPRDYHNSMAADEPLGVDMSSVELAAFERGRMQGEVEAVRRLEADGRLVPAGGAVKTFASESTSLSSTSNLVQINQMTLAQWAAAIVGEVFSLGYLVIMAVWLEQYRDGGLDWSNSNYNGNKGMFNIHVWTGFAALWLVSQAYITYRLLPLTTNPLLNKAYYVLCHVLALACLGISIACAMKSEPVEMAWSMHAWTAYLATALYASHAIYSCVRVLLTRHGVTERTWNESRPWQDATAEQGRDGEMVRDTLYRAAPSVWSRWRRSSTERNLAATGVQQGASPVWAEQTSLRHDEFFLVPRKKWAVTSLFALMASVLIGLGEWQVLLARSNSNWAQGDPSATGGAVTDGSVGGDGSPTVDQQQVGLFSTESVLIGVIGLLTLAGTCALGYAAMPPRTTIVKAGDYVARRTSVSQQSAVGSTAPQSQAAYGDAV